MRHSHLDPSFSVLGFDRATQQTFFGNITVISLPAGHQLCRQGANRMELMWILDGEVDVVRNGEHIAHLGAGTVLGEINVLGERSYQTADVFATTPVLVGVQTLVEWRNVATRAPHVAEMVEKLASERLVEQKR